MYFILLVSALIAQTHAYVLLQVSKDEQNRSNVDALIHKVLPLNQFDEIADKLSRKQYIIKADTQDIEKRGKGNTEDNVRKALREIIDKKPIFRTRSQQISPDVVNFKGKEPSLVYEIKSNTIIDVIQDFLSSNLVRKYANAMAKEAAIVYRTIADSKQFKKMYQ